MLHHNKRINVFKLISGRVWSVAMPPCITCKMFPFSSHVVSHVVAIHVTNFLFTSFFLSRRRHEITMEEFLTNQSKLRCILQFLQFFWPLHIVWPTFNLSISLFHCFMLLFFDSFRRVSPSDHGLSKALGSLSFEQNLQTRLKYMGPEQMSSTSCTFVAIFVL